MALKEAVEAKLEEIINTIDIGSMSSAYDISNTINFIDALSRVLKALKEPHKTHYDYHDMRTWETHLGEKDGESSAESEEN